MLTALITLSVLAFTISLCSFFYFRSYIKRRTSHDHILLELREEVNGIARLIDETTDRDISLIEEKEKELKGLLANVDKRLQLYIREWEKRREVEAIQATLAAQTQSLPETPPEAPSPSLPLSAQIREMVCGGFAPIAIAAHLGISVAEVEIVAALIERKDSGIDV